MFGKLVLFLLGAVSLASATAPSICTIPATVREGCAACYSCELVQETTDEVLASKTETSVDLIRCRAFFNAHGISDPDPVLCQKMNFYTTKTTPIYKKVEVCQCNPTQVMQGCLDSNTSAFIIESPNKTCSKEKVYPSNIVCHWNLPEADQIYMHLLKQDIEGNPNDGTVGCKDKLIMKSEDWNEDLVTCGSPPATRPASKIYNSVHSESPNVFFSSDDMEEAYGFQILLVYLSKKQPMNIRGHSIPRKTLSNGRSTNAEIDVHCPPSFNPFTTCCECPKINITQLCPNGSLERNIYYQKMLAEISNPSSSCPGIGTTGFSGVKGCTGAEFLHRGILPGSLTEEECENMQLGMTDHEAIAFMSRGSALWCDCSPPSSSTFCMDDIPATRLNAEELIKLEALLAGCVNAADYRASDNAVLRTVGKVCLEMQHVPVLKLSDGSLC